MIDSPIFGLLLLGVLVATPLVLRRLRANAPDGLRVLGRTALHKSAVVAVVAVGDRRLVVGAGEKGVQLLAELDADADELPAEATSDAPLDLIDLDARTDAAVGSAWTDPDLPAAIAARLGPPGSSGSTAGPRIGLVDRLRAMTVRVSAAPHVGGAGRPSRVPLRR